MLKPLLSIIALAAMLAFTPINAPSAMAADTGPKYELTITITPIEAQVAKGAKAITVLPTNDNKHNAFESKAECETHFDEADVPGIMFSFLQIGVAPDQYTVTHSCSPAGRDT